jgi:dTDP-glucose pyrophosphorylase
VGVAPRSMDGRAQTLITTATRGDVAEMVLDSIDNFVLPEDATLFEALRVIDRSATGIALVCDGALRLLGTATDGDIRRAILAGRGLYDTPVSAVMNTQFTAVTQGVGRAEVLDTMRARSIDQVPVLDARGRLIGLHMLHRLLSSKQRPNAAVIMAGGKGTRLRPMTEVLPKPMIKVAGRPILERLVLHLAGFGISRIFLSINYLGHLVEEHFGDGSDFGCSIEYLRESEPRGTGGCLSLLPRSEAHPVVVMNGDLVTQANIGRLLDFHEDAGFTATMGVRPHVFEIPFGVVDLDENRLVGIREKPSERVLINAGIYVISPAVLNFVPDSGEFPITDLFRTCLERQLPTGAHVLEDDWIDVGRPDQLQEANGKV